MTNAILVFLGGGLGSLARYGMTLWAAAWFGAQFPYGTLIVNVLGGIAMGAIAGGLQPYLDLKGTFELRILVMTGFLGGFTTFSAFSLDAVSLWQRGAFVDAAIYVVASVILAIGGLALGLAFTKAV